MRAAVAGIVLAAGEGRRYGAPKATISFEGQLLVERAVSSLRAGGCDPVVVVLGASAAAVEATADLSRAVVVHNASWRDGMATSLRAGLDAAEAAGACAVLVLHVDQPVVTPALVARLIEGWRQGAIAAAAAFRGQALTPVVLDRSLWESVRAQAKNDQGARVILRRNPHLVTAIDCDDVGDARDIDVPEDLAPLERRYREVVAARRAAVASHRSVDHRLGS